MRCPRKSICAAIGILLLLVFIWIGSISTRYPSVSFPVAGQNSYPDFLRAAALVANTSPDYSQQESLERFVSQSTEAYPLVTSALRSTCRVPIEVSQQWWARHYPGEMGSLRQLTYGMIAKAKLAEFAGETEAAFEGYTEAFRFADAIGRGGLSGDFLNSISCRALVLQHCQSLLSSLTSEQRSDFLGLIQRSAAEQEDPAVVVRRTQQWQGATFGFRGRLEIWRDRLRTAWQARSLAPLAPGSQRKLLATRKSRYEREYENVVCARLRVADHVNETDTKPGGPANWSQPIRSQTNSTSSAAGSRR
jgi:hypothetical protein